MNQTGNKDIVGQAKQTVANVASQAKEGVTQQLDSRKDKAVETIGSVSSAIREAGDKLKDAGPLPQLAERAADGIDRVASFFENRDLVDLVSGVERFARREPALFLGGAVALGVLAGRFLKSSASRQSTYAYGGGAREFGDTYETYGYGGSGYESEYGDEGEYLTEDTLQDDWEEPMGFQAEDRGISTASSSSGVGSATAEQPLRTTQPMGSQSGYQSSTNGNSFGATQGSSGAAAPGLAGASASGSSATGGGVNVGSSTSSPSDSSFGQSNLSRKP